MPLAGTIVADTLRTIGMTVLGIALALVPPALWVAWTETILLGVVGIAVASAAAIVVLANYENDSAGDPKAATGIGIRRTIPDETVAEIHRIFPLTYHHSLVEKGRFRRVMDRLRRVTDREV